MSSSRKNNQSHDEEPSSPSVRNLAQLFESSKMTSPIRSPPLSEPRNIPRPFTSPKRNNRSISNNNDDDSINDNINDNSSIHMPIRSSNIHRRNFLQINNELKKVKKSPIKGNRN